MSSLFSRGSKLFYLDKVKHELRLKKMSKKSCFETEIALNCIHLSGAVELTSQFVNVL